MDDILHPAPTEHDGQRGIVFVFLSLFVLVLAFFIVLVSISTVEATKSKAVMQSLTSTFTATERPLASDMGGTLRRARRGEGGQGHPGQHCDHHQQQ